MTDPVSTLRDQLQQLQQLQDRGVLSAETCLPARAALERQLIDAVLAAPAAGVATPASTATAAPAPAAPRPSRRLWLGATLLVLAVAGTGYGLTGSPGSAGAPGGTAAAFSAAAGPAAGAASAPHAIGSEQISAMVGRLEERLQAQPDDAEGWSMLGRTYMALKRYPGAAAATQKALKLRPDDATLLADHADAMAVNGGRSLEGEPRRLLERALAIEPDNLKALVLLGTAAFNRGDFAQAVTRWQRAVQVGPADSPMAESARGGLAEARERAGQPATAAAPALALPAGRQSADR
jgi:cytochrome c-type biogenesis protein CcmH